MPTLHIEHAVTSFSEWKSAFDKFAEFRARSGVRRSSIGRPVDDALVGTPQTRILETVVATGSEIGAQPQTRA
jgi:hypothetical protein